MVKIPLPYYEHQDLRKRTLKVLLNAVSRKSGVLGGDIRNKGNRKKVLTAKGVFLLVAHNMGYSFVEIADYCGMTTHGVKKCIHRAIYYIESGKVRYYRDVIKWALYKMKVGTMALGWDDDKDLGVVGRYGGTTQGSRAHLIKVDSKTYKTFKNVEQYYEYDD